MAMRIGSIVAGVGLLCAVAGTVQVQGVFAQDNAAAKPADDLGIARFTAEDKLIFPIDTDRWVFLGANIGGDYAESEFDPGNPGVIGVVQMEPTAYAYLLENGRYADGTMLLLSFFESDDKPEPELSGFVQGALLSQEIHVIDRDKYEDGRGFYLFADAARDPSQVLQPGNECVKCHEDHGAFDGTFVQFYPAVREFVPDE